MPKIDLDKLLKGRQPKDLDELNQILQEEMQRLNDGSIPEFCGVSPNQMRFLLYDPLAFEISTRRCWTAARFPAGRRYAPAHGADSQSL